MKATQPQSFKSFLRLELSGGNELLLITLAYNIVLPRTYDIIITSNKSHLPFDSMHTFPLLAEETLFWKRYTSGA